MMGKRVSAVVVVAAFTAHLTLFLLTSCVDAGLFDWMQKDNFDDVMSRIDAITLQNCKHKPESELRLPIDTIAQEPQFNKLKDNIIFANRSSLLHLHNMALNRAFFYSYILQKMNTINDAIYEPGLLYHYFSTVADVAANPGGINGSGTYFDTNKMYPNFIKNVNPNNTIPRFGPRSWRLDDYNEPTNFLREPTNRTIETVDYGAGTESDYTEKSYKLNQWYKLWQLPDVDSTLDSVRKYKYSSGIKYSNATGQFVDNEYIGFEFFGPSSPGQNAPKKFMPVLFTPPYFDCGRSNKWIVSAVAPVVDYLPRYLRWEHLRRHSIVGVVSMDIDFLKIDMNQCRESEGNPGPNHFFGTDRCKPTTMCEPLPGYGFRRGGYQCLCRPGFRLPFYQRRPFQGSNIEVATDEEYINGFDCVPIGNRRVFPVVQGTTHVGRRVKRSVEYFDREELERRELKFAELLFSQHLEKYESKARARAAAKAKSVAVAATKRDFLEKVLPQLLLRQSVSKAEKAIETVLVKNVVDKKDQRLFKRFRPKYSYNELAKEKFLSLAMPKMIDREELKRKKRFVSRYGAPWQNVFSEKRTKIVSRRKRDLRMQNIRAAFDKEFYDRVVRFIQLKNSVSKENCFMKSEDDLQLPGDFAYGKEVFFESQARVALRLAHFLSIFLQNVDLYEEYGNIRGDRFLNVNQTFSEVLANVMSDNKIKASGIWFDRDQYRNASMSREYFAPYAWKQQPDSKVSTGDENLSFRAKDMAGMIHGMNNYVFQPFFKDVKDRWASNTYGLERFTIKPMVRTDKEGSAIKRFEHYPMFYYGPRLEDGHWTPPVFDCDGEIKDWIITYAVPFFGLNILRTRLEFKGVVTVTVLLDDLDIQQCPAQFYMANAFKNTARCDYESTVCVHLPGRRFRMGGYKCECKQGYEYPFNDYAWFYDGQTMEAEYDKMILGRLSRFSTLKCRESSAASLHMSWLLASGLVFLSYILQR